MIDLLFYKKRNNFILNVYLKTEKKIILLAGPSGSGKTTLLRCMAGLEKTEKAKLIINDRLIDDHEKNIFTIPQKRKAGYLNQHYFLFPHKNVKKNLEFVTSPKEYQKMEWVLDELEIKSLLEKKPDELSGGERQRIALAQVIIYQPDYFLLDEPFSALNYSLKKKVCEVIKKIIKERNTPLILSTHDLSAGILLEDISWHYIEEGSFIKGNWKFNPQTQTLVSE